MRGGGGLGPSGKCSSAKAATAQSLLGLVVRGDAEESGVGSPSPCGFMFPQTTSSFSPPRPPPLSAPLVVLGGDVAVLESLVGFPEPAVPAGK